MVFRKINEQYGLRMSSLGDTRVLTSGIIYNKYGQEYEIFITFSNDNSVKSVGIRLNNV